jgi:hypothetical protein
MDHFLMAAAIREDQQSWFLSFPSEKFFLMAQTVMDSFYLPRRLFNRQRNFKLSLSVFEPSGIGSTFPSVA